MSETGNLDKLEKCLRKSPGNAADAEEIYEELDVIRPLKGILIQDLNLAFFHL